MLPQRRDCVLSCLYNHREKDVWGEDAHAFNPERWLDPSKGKRGTLVGVYSNLYVAFLPMAASPLLTDNLFSD